MSSYFECYYGGESGVIALYSHTPHYCEKVPFSNICDYFRRPVYRRRNHV